jgi:cyclic pyranopterin phosphate synthase
MAKRLSHVDTQGRLKMVNVGAKRVTKRTAVARGHVRTKKTTLAHLAAGTSPKGNVLAAAHVAGVLAAKRTAEIIPLAHSLPLDGVDMQFELDPKLPGVRIEAGVSCTARTGVEMEALTAVSAAALTIYDMLKAVDRSMVIGDIALWEKRGGRSGIYRRRR